MNQEKSSAKLTILMMAVKPTFFADAINSVLHQTFQNFKLVISDNTDDAAIINRFREEFNDPRIQWVHARPHTGGEPIAHYKYVLKFVDTPYFKYMSDDDLLYPTSCTCLVEMLDQNPSIVGAFHGRHVINQNGSILYPYHWIKPGETKAYTELQIAELIFNTACNLFGEPPFSMFRATVADHFSMSFDGWPFRYLADIIYVLNYSRLGWLGGSESILGAYRVHGDQESSQVSPIRLSAMVEQELMCRVLNARHNFPPQAIVISYRKLLATYQEFAPQFPILSRFADNMTASVNAGTFVPDRTFYGLWAEARKEQGLPLVECPV